MKLAGVFVVLFGIGLLIILFLACVYSNTSFSHKINSNTGSKAQPSFLGIRYNQEETVAEYGPDLEMVGQAVCLKVLIVMVVVVVEAVVVELRSISLVHLLSFFWYNVSY